MKKNLKKEVLDLTRILAKIGLNLYVLHYRFNENQGLDYSQENKLDFETIYKQFDIVYDILNIRSKQENQIFNKFFDYIEDLEADLEDLMQENQTLHNQIVNNQIFQSLLKRIEYLEKENQQLKKRTN